LSEVAPRGMKAKGLQVHAQRDALLARAGGCVESWMHKVDVNPYLPILFFVFVYVREMGKGEKKLLCTQVFMFVYAVDELIWAPDSTMQFKPTLPI
jgi:hypothetical protein